MLSHGAMIAVLPGADPTALGWLLAVTHVVAGALCGIIAVRTAGERGPGTGHQRPFVWWSIAATCVVLGINEQLDLHRPVGRAIGDALGVSGLGIGPMIGIAALGALVVIVLLLMTRAAWAVQWPAIGGLAVLGLIALGETSARRLVDVRMTGSAEWLGLLAIAAAAVAGLLVVSRTRRRDALGSSAWRTVVETVGEEPEDAPIPIGRGTLRSSPPAA